MIQESVFVRPMARWPASHFGLHTVSEPSTIIITGVIPLYLLACKRQAIYRRRSEGDRQAIEEQTASLPTSRKAETMDCEINAIRPSMDIQEAQQGGVLHHPAFFGSWVLPKLMHKIGTILRQSSLSELPGCH